jgi:hypothetical protein
MKNELGKIDNKCGIADSIYNYTENDEKKRELLQFIKDYLEKLYKEYGEDFYLHISEKFIKEMQESIPSIFTFSSVYQIAKRFLTSGKWL